MARLNQRPTPAPRAFTHEGAPAAQMTTMQALRRSVASCLLWENEFYEDGQLIADRIFALAQKVKPNDLAALAIEARESFNLRHVPLLLLAALARTGSGSPIVSETIARVIQRADELSEFLVIYAKQNGVKPSALKPKLSHGVRKGLAAAFGKFDEYRLAKYNRDSVVKLKDVLFLSHAKPKDAEQDALWKRLIAGELATPDTWEVELSAGKDKRATFERLIAEGKLGYLALLRNLRNMAQSGVDDALVRGAILARKGGAHRVLPFRYTAAARAAPLYERELDKALVASIGEAQRLEGRTVVLVDVSGSMDAKLSVKSDLTRADAAATLAAVIPSDNLRVLTFSNAVVEVPPRRGMAGVDAVLRSQTHGGTELGAAVNVANRHGGDRLIVITDEQSASRVPAPTFKHAYMINVASAKNGVGYGNGWKHIDGFSESVIRYIAEIERLDD